MYDGCQQLPSRDTALICDYGVIFPRVVLALWRQIDQLPINRPRCRALHDAFSVLLSLVGCSSHYPHTSSDYVYGTVEELRAGKPMYRTVALLLPRALIKSRKLVAAATVHQFRRIYARRTRHADLSRGTRRHTYGKYRWGPPPSTVRKASSLAQLGPFDLVASAQRRSDHNFVVTESCLLLLNSWAGSLPGSRHDKSESGSKKASLVTPHSYLNLCVPANKGCSTRPAQAPGSPTFFAGRA
eukprot:scaffold366169_cov22-Prasinocladus_malaysianus.AAC.1